MRLVLDTNVAVSALLWRGKPYQLISTIRGQRDIDLLTSAVLLEELAEVLARPFAASRLSLLSRAADDLLTDYAGFTETVMPLAVPAVIANDPDDDHVIAAALAGGADYIVSGDEHLLALKTYRGIRVLTPAQALAAITA